MHPRAQTQPEWNQEENRHTCGRSPYRTIPELTRRWHLAEDLADDADVLPVSIAETHQAHVQAGRYAKSRKDIASGPRSTPTVAVCAPMPIANIARRLADGELRGKDIISSRCSG